MSFSKQALLGVSFIAMAGMSVPAAAQSAEDWAAMEQRMNAMEQRLGVQEQQLDAANARADSAEQRATAAEARVAKVEEKAGSGVNVEWKGAPKLSNDKGFSFKPRGRILYDTSNFDVPVSNSSNSLGFTNEMRRARLGAEGTVPGGFGYKFEIDFAGNGVEFTDTYMDYSKGGLTITAGQHNNFQSLQEISSSNDIAFMERAAFTDAFGFERKVGLSAQYIGSDILAQAGVFSDNIDNLSTSSDQISVDGRLAYTPKMGDTQIHVGGSIHYTDYGKNGENTRYRQRPYLHGTGVRPIDTGSRLSSSQTTYGLEALAINGPLHATAEAHWAKPNYIGVTNDPTYFGAFAEVGYFLTGNSRGYKHGALKGPKVKNGFDNGGSGAIEIAGRFDYLDLSDAGFIGGKQNAYEMALSWWPVEYVRLAVNYGHIVYKNAAVADLSGNRDYNADVIGTRFQVAF